MKYKIVAEMMIKCVYEVEANSPKEAKEKLYNGQGVEYLEEVDGSAAYGDIISVEEEFEESDIEFRRRML